MNELLNQFIAIREYMIKLRFYFIKNSVFSYTALITLQKHEHICINNDIGLDGVTPEFDDRVNRHIVNCGAVSEFLYLVFSKDAILKKLKGLILYDEKNDHVALALEINNMIYIVDFWIYFLYDHELEVWGDCPTGYFGTLEDYEERVKRSKFFKYEFAVSYIMKL